MQPFSPDETGVTVFAVNRSQESHITLECCLSNAGDMKVIEHLVLENDDVNATNTEEDPDRVIPHSDGKSVMKSDKLVAEMPALSWHVIRMKRQ